MSRELPKYMEARPMKRGGVSYRMRLPDGKKILLGHTIEEAMQNYAARAPMSAQDATAETLWKRHRKGSLSRGIPFELSIEDVRAMVVESKGRCAVTQKRFSNERPEGSRIRPWALSIDRKDSTAGYSRANCRLVCAYVNVAMNRFGDALFLELIEAIVRRVVRQELLSKMHPSKRPISQVGN